MFDVKIKKQNTLVRFRIQESRFVPQLAIRSFLLREVGVGGRSSVQDTKGSRGCRAVRVGEGGEGAGGEGETR